MAWPRPPTPCFELVEGRVARILGSYDVTDVEEGEYETTHLDHAAAHAAGTVAVPGGPYARTERHRFVNVSREFAMTLEVGGRTLRLVSGDYLAVAAGDEVRALCEPSPGGPLLVRDWHDVTRGIRLRTYPTPLAGAGGAIAASLGMVVTGAFWLAKLSDPGGPGLLDLVGVALLVLAVILAIAACAEADRLQRLHRALDRLAASHTGTVAA